MWGMIGRVGFMGGLMLYLLAPMGGDDSGRLVHPFFDGLPGDGQWVAAHRGGKHLWPENTLLAFERALERGAHMLEMDIRSSADGVPVVIHDETVDRTTDGSGRVREFTFQELRLLDAAYGWSGRDEPHHTPYRGAGFAIPSLDEVFQAFPEARMVIEIKEVCVDLIEAVGELIEKYQRQNTTMVASFHTRVLKQFRAAHPDVATSAGRSEVFRFWLAQKLFLLGTVKPDYVAIQAPEWFRGIHLVTPGFIEAARQKNLSVHVWTVNDTSDITRLFQSGVDMVITDVPDYALDMIVRIVD